MEFPFEFPLHLQLPFGEKLIESVYRNFSATKVKKRIGRELGFEKDDLKLFFEDREVKDDEKLEDLVAFGFTNDSPLNVEIANSFPVCVETCDEKTHQFAIQSGTTMLQLKKRVGRRTELQFWLISIECDGRVLYGCDAVGEVCVEGKRIKTKMKDSSLCELFSPSVNITIESVRKILEEIKTIQFCDLKEIATEEFFSRLNELIDKYEEDSNMILLLTLLVEEVAYKGAIHSNMREFNHFHSQFTVPDCYSEFETIMLKQHEKENSIMPLREKEKEKEKISPLLLHSALTNSLMMKAEDMHTCLLPIMIPVFLSSLTSSPHSREERERRSRILLALSCLAGGSPPFLFSSHLLLI
jgi:hypothetical protein